MVVRLGLCVGVGLAVLLAGCGSGDPVGTEGRGALNVSSGGGGQILFPATQTTLNFADSLTVAIQGANDQASQFIIYTLFGLNRLDYNHVPTAALVTFIDGQLPNASSTTALPSSVVTIALHTGFDTTKVNPSGGILAQDAPVKYTQTSNGSFVLEPRPSTDGAFVPQNSPNRQARWATVTLLNSSSGAQALLSGFVPYVLSQPSTQEFLGYAGNLGLNTKPPVSGGGPPPPPGSTTTGSSGGSTSGSSGSSNPPAAPF